jgi:peptidoglycan hydrolase CwlO-like protein
MATPTPQASSVLELGSKILFVVVPATFAWVIKLEVANAQQDLEIKQIQKAAQESKLQEKDITDIKVQIGMLQVKQDSLSAKIDKLYSVIIESGGSR